MEDTILCMLQFYDSFKGSLSAFIPGAACLHTALRNGSFYMDELETRYLGKKWRQAGVLGPLTHGSPMYLRYGCSADNILLGSLRRLVMWILGIRTIR